MALMQVPHHLWPRNWAEMQASSAQLGGRTFFRIGPLIEKESVGPDGGVVKVRRPAWTEFWVDLPDKPLPAPVPVAPPKDEKVAGFLKALARTSVRAWAESGRLKSKGGAP